MSWLVRMLNVQPLSKKTSQPQLDLRRASPGFFLREDEMIALWRRYKPILHFKKQSSVIEFYYNAGMLLNLSTQGIILP